MASFAEGIISLAVVKEDSGLTLPNYKLGPVLYLA